MSTSLTPNSTKASKLPNTPHAPKKRVSLAERRGRLDNIPKLEFPQEEREKVEWCVLAESGYVRDKYLFYTPEDIAEIDDLDTLEEIRLLYMPTSQPRHILEAAYLQLIIDSINERLYHM